jgi:hypothetical protein
MYDFAMMQAFEINHKLSSQSTPMKHLLLLITIILFLPSKHEAQGCAGVKNISEFSQYQYLQSDLGSTGSPWIVGINNRYFKAFRVFRGKVDLEVPARNQAVNRNFTTEISINRLMNRGWSLTLALPVSANNREASGEHSGPDTERFKTSAFGLGDIRLSVSKWMLKPTETLKGNFQLGFGLKFPTGDFAQKDYFHRNGSLVLAAVNPGIQPGDGGLGLIAELNAYYDIGPKLGLYANLYYMANPRENNGESWGGFTYTEEQIQAGIDLMSVPDAFALRGGVYFDIISTFTLSAGIRHEGVPVNDFIGGSKGGRRPGYYSSVEPGFILRTPKVSFYGYAPVIISREIKQTVGGKLLGAHGPGGSANFQIFFGALFKL